MDIVQDLELVEKAIRDFKANFYCTGDRQLKADLIKSVEYTCRKALDSLQVIAREDDRL